MAESSDYSPLEIYATTMSARNAIGGTDGTGQHVLQHLNKHVPNGAKMPPDRPIPQPLTTEPWDVTPKKSTKRT